MYTFKSKFVNKYLNISYFISYKRIKVFMLDICNIIKKLYKVKKRININQFKINRKISIINRICKKIKMRYFF